LRVERMPKYCQAFHLDIAILFLTTAPSTYVGRKLRKLILRPILLFCSYIRHLMRRTRKIASFSTMVFRLRRPLTSFI